MRAILRSIPEALKPSVLSVCIDMHEAYAAAVHEVLPEAKLIVDRFHVAKAYRNGADELRKSEQRRSPPDEPEHGNRNWDVRIHHPRQHGCH